MAAITKRNRTGGMYKYFFMVDFIIIYQYLFKLAYLEGIFCAKSDVIAINVHKYLKSYNYMHIVNCKKSQKIEENWKRKR